ncbi:11967_t:CDS:2 [Funneliformis caledonium]|uniref:11967_t:CDS:1 n=1 Tax=Funneliformis caledonium TaxID=1117310 RepID=A0A9N9C678_9GLOM|nr:11967_t:CDS:2 [Funneliformis caledonium]
MSDRPRRNITASATTMPDRPRRNLDTRKTPATALSDRPRRNIPARATASNTSVTSTRKERTTTHRTSVTKRKRRVVEEAASTSQVNITNQPASGTTVERRRSKKVKFTQVETSASQVATSSRGDQPSIATIQETQVASSVVIQDTTIPQVTTTTIPVMRTTPKKRGRGRPPKASNGSVVGQNSRKRGYHAVEEEHKFAFKPKRRKGDTFAIPIPIRPQQVGQVYAIGLNDCAQCGMDESTEHLKKVRLIPSLGQFNIVDISAGSLHSAALTSDGKIVTWGCNDHGTLGRFTEAPKSAFAKEIFDAGNYEIGEENKPAYAEGLDNVNIVKVICGGNATFAISDQGHLYATGTFKGKDGILGFSYDHHVEQPIFTRYKLFENLTIVDIAANVDHVLALTTEGDVYSWGNGEAFRLGRKISERKSPNPLMPYDLGLKHIVRMYAGSYHNFVIDNNGKVLVFGLNNTGQCGISAPKQAIIPPEKHSFFNKMGEGQKVEEFAVGEHHTLARTQDGRVFSFGRTDYGQLGLGDSILPDTKETKGRLVTPTVIPGLSSIKSIGAGDNFSMAVKMDNKIYAWGFGDNYVLGNKKEEDATSPFLIPDLEEFKSKDIVRISCGSSHALFLMATASNLGGDAMDVDTN